VGPFERPAERERPAVFLECLRRLTAALEDGAQESVEPRQVGFPDLDLLKLVGGLVQHGELEVDAAEGEGQRHALRGARARGLVERDHARRAALGPVGLLEAGQEREGRLGLDRALPHAEGLPGFARRGVGVSQRDGGGQEIGLGAERLPDTVLLLDTVGELSGAYAAADLAFVGGSLVPKGGHNVLEPSWHGVPTIVGPHMENFREIAEVFLAGDALIRVAGEEELADRLTRFAANPRIFRETGLRAKDLLETLRGASEASTDAVLSAFPGGEARR